MDNCAPAGSHGRPNRQDRQLRLLGGSRWVSAPNHGSKAKARHEQYEAKNAARAHGANQEE